MGILRIKIADNNHMGNYISLILLCFTYT